MKYVKYVSSRSWRYAEKFSTEYTYVTDSHEIASILDYIGLEHMKHNVSAIMALVGDGDYDEIWITESSTPYYKACVYNKVIHYYKEESKPKMYKNIPYSKIMEKLPHGSGINSTWREVEPGVFSNTFDHMDCMGGYDGYYDFVVEFTADDFTVEFTDKEIITYDEEGIPYDDMDMMIEYLEETIYYAVGGL